MFFVVILLTTDSFETLFLQQIQGTAFVEAGFEVTIEGGIFAALLLMHFCFRAASDTLRQAFLT
jgi:hypothetical protein